MKKLSYGVRICLIGIVLVAVPFCLETTTRSKFSFFAGECASASFCLIAYFVATRLHERRRLRKFKDLSLKMYKEYGFNVSSSEGERENQPVDKDEARRFFVLRVPHHGAHTREISPTKSHRRSFFIKLPQFWTFFSFLLPKKIKVEAFEPAYNDMLADFLIAKNKYRSKAARRWLLVCFGFRTVLMIADCLRVFAQDKVWKGIEAFLPQGLRSWWHRF